MAVRRRPGDRGRPHGLAARVLGGARWSGVDCRRSGLDGSSGARDWHLPADGHHSATASTSLTSIFRRVAGRTPNRSPTETQPPTRSSAEPRPETRAASARSDGELDDSGLGQVQLGHYAPNGPLDRSPTHLGTVVSQRSRGRRSGCRHSGHPSSGSFGGWRPRTTPLRADRTTRSRSSQRMRPSAPGR